MWILTDAENNWRHIFLFFQHIFPDRTTRDRGRCGDVATTNYNAPHATCRGLSSFVYHSCHITSDHGSITPHRTLTVHCVRHRTQLYVSQYSTYMCHHNVNYNENNILIEHSTGGEALKMTDHQNCKAWNCRTLNCKTWQISDLFIVVSTNPCNFSNIVKNLM